MLTLGCRELKEGEVSRAREVLVCALCRTLAPWIPAQHPSPP